MPHSILPFSVKKHLIPLSQSASSKSSADEASMAREASRAEVVPGELSRSSVDNRKQEVESTYAGTVRQGRRPMEEGRGISERLRSSDAAIERGEHAREGVQQKEQPSVPSNDSMRPHQSTTTRYTLSRKYTSASEKLGPTESRRDTDRPVSAPEPTYGLRHDAKPPSLSSEQPRLGRPDVPQPNAPTYQSAFPLQITEPHKRYETLFREHEFLRGEYEAKTKRLEDREQRVKSLKVDFADLQRCYEEQSAALASTRNELKSCQSQLDNVQRFISTADTHADQDIIQKLQELNESIYQLAMSMADRVVEGFVRQSAMARRTKEPISVEEGVLATIGQAMVNHLAVVEGDEDVALFLQIAFQGYLSRFFCHVVSLWTVDQRLHELIDNTYHRLRKAEMHSISGHWRSLTRTYILPTAVSDPKALVQYAIKALSSIVLAAGISSPQHDIASKLSSKFGERITSIISHAGKFGDMISGMISGNFEILIVVPGATFDRETMVDMNGGDKSAPQERGPAQTVLCTSRMGLKKQVGERNITLTEAHVVLESFLG